MKKLYCVLIVFNIVGFCQTALPVESGMYRLLSISNSEKLILVSQIPSKTKYILDITSAKITVDGKPAELKDLKSYAIIRLKFDLRKSKKNGIDVDGTVAEIRITTTEKSN